MPASAGPCVTLSSLPAGESCASGEDGMSRPAGRKGSFLTQTVFPHYRRSVLLVKSHMTHTPPEPMVGAPHSCQSLGARAGGSGDGRAGRRVLRGGNRSWDRSANDPGSVQAGTSRLASEGRPDEENGRATCAKGRLCSERLDRSR